jgi:uncharacterized membrane protein YjdF
MDRNYALSGVMIALLAICFLALALLIALLLWGTIYKKAGYSRAIGLLMLIPLVNVITLIWFAVARWPLEEEVARLRLNSGQPPVPPAYSR